MKSDSNVCYLGTDKTVKHKASLKVGEQITIQNVKKYWTKQVLANKYRKNTHTCEKKQNKFLIFSSVALQVPQPHGSTLALDSVFSCPA